YFFVVWHDATANTINISVNNTAAASTGHSTGVNSGTSALFLGLNEEGVAFLNGRLDSISIWKRLLTPSERTRLYNSGNGLDYPFN
ncbi:MAG TPA: LamG-like jellyroll fold domain-containing protein, partial [Verrucomicrobiae bacterium]|nr:LamG-like jellyroll fold domain-containing protein [Verrucomicrobiae bacterium]